MENVVLNLQYIFIDDRIPQQVHLTNRIVANKIANRARNVLVIQRLFKSGCERNVDRSIENS